MAELGNFATDLLSYMKRLLIIEDDTDIREVLEVYFLGRGHETCTVGCRDDAIIKLHERPNLDCIIMDWCMPGLTCIQFMKELKALPFKGGVIMLSGGADARQIARELGIPCFSQKPLDLEALAEMVDNGDCSPRFDLCC